MSTGEGRPREAATQRDSEALWRSFYRKLRRFVARRVESPADVEDILQTVFLNLHRRLDAIEQEERIGAFLFRVTRNTVVDHYRSSGRYAALPEEELPAREDGEDPAVRKARRDVA